MRDQLSEASTHLRSISVREVFVPRALISMGVSVFMRESARDRDSIAYKHSNRACKWVMIHGETPRDWS